MSRVSTKTVVVVGVFVAILLAGFVSFYASGSPDGLNKVAIDEGFAYTEEEHGAADGPLAGYETDGVANGRLSGGLAGVVGSVVVLAIAGGVVYAVRRKHTADTS